MDTRDVIAYNVRRIIQEKGLKNKAVAERINFNERMFSALICGRKIITAEHVMLLCQALGVDANEMYQSSPPDQQVS